MQRLRALAAGILLLGAVTLGRAAFAQEGPPPDGPPPGMDAQQPEPPGINPAHELAQLTKKLKLTEEQRTSIRPVLEERAKRMQALFADAAGPSPDKRNTAMQIGKETDAKVRDLLTDDQKARYDKMTREREASMPPNPT